MLNEAGNMKDKERKKSKTKLVAYLIVQAGLNFHLAFNLIAFCLLALSSYQIGVVQFVLIVCTVLSTIHYSKCNSRI